MNRRRTCAVGLIASLALEPNCAIAGSSFATSDATPITASASLDFTIIVPKFVFLRVGTGADMSESTTIDNLVFAVPPDRIGDGSEVPAMSGQIIARVMGNNGSITLSSSTSGPMNNREGDTISYSEIAVTVAPETTGIALAHPPLLDGTANSINLPTTSGNITKLDARWTFTYLNRHAVPAGTYGGIGQRNGRVNYSVSIP